MRFEQKVAVITGGSAGMGKAAALGFSAEGAAVVINDINEEQLVVTAEEIQQAGGKVATVLGDITASDTIKTLVDTAVKTFGTIDILFNYVGGDPDMAPQTAFVDQTEDFWDRMINLNLKTTLLVSRAVLDVMMPRKYGKIINTGAIAGKVGGPNMALYSAVKGGIIAFTKALAIEMAPYGINVNCVCPGPIATPGIKKVFADQIPAEVAAIAPLNRLGTPEEVASAVMYLASDAAAYITGQALSVDGGATRI